MTDAAHSLAPELQQRRRHSESIRRLGTIMHNTQPHRHRSSSRRHPPISSACPTASWPQSLTSTSAQSDYPGSLEVSRSSGCGASTYKQAWQCVGLRQVTENPLSCQALPSLHVTVWHWQTEAPAQQRTARRATRQQTGMLTTLPHAALSGLNFHLTSPDHLARAQQRAHSRSSLTALQCVRWGATSGHPPPHASISPCQTAAG